MKYFLSYLLVLFLIVACKSTKTLTDDTALNPNLKPKQILRIHNKKKTEFSTLQARVRFELKVGDKSQTHTVNLRMERDNIIWINAFLNMIRIKITPNKVQMYNKLNNTFFEGDFSLVEEFLGVNFNFDHIQNLLLAEIIFPHKPQSLTKRDDLKTYVLFPKKQSPILNILYSIHPKYFKLEGLEFSQLKEQRLFQVKYQSYQVVDKQIVPQQMAINIFDGPKKMTLSMNLKSVNLNQPLRFPFKIPSGYKPIKL